MANQALIASARRMYQAQAQVTDITPVLQAATSSISNITNAITEKRKDQEERSEQEVKTNFINIIKNNPNISPDLVTQLNNTQDQYFDALKKSENLFLSRDKREQAATDLRNIEGELAALEKSLVNVDLKRAQTPRGEVSNWNNTATQAEDVMFHDDTMLAKNIMFEDRVAYLKTAGYNEEESFESNVESKGIIRLDEYKPPMTKYTEAILDITSKATSVQNLALQNGYVFKGSSLQNELVSQMRAYLDTDKGFSLLADNIGNFNWLDQQLLDEREGFTKDKDGNDIDPGVVRREDGVIEITNPEIYDNNIEKLKERVKNDEKRYKQEFIDDYNKSLILISEESVAKYEAKQQEIATRTGQEKPYNTTVGYYDKQGLRSLISNVYKTEEDAKNNPPIVFSKEKQYRKFEDGRFYQLDANDGKLNKDALGFTEDQMLSMLRVDGYLDMFDFGTTTEEQSSGDIPLPADTMSSISQETQDIINSYPSASALQEAIDNGEVTDQGAINFVNMLKQEAGDSTGTTLDQIAADITPEQKSSKGNARIIDVRYGPLKTTKIAGRAKGDKVLTLVGVTEKEYLQYKELPTLGKTAEQKKLQKKVKDAIEKARKVAENKK